jgi:hypothetical protein
MVPCFAYAREYGMEVSERYPYIAKDVYDCSFR